LWCNMKLSKQPTRFCALFLIAESNKLKYKPSSHPRTKFWEARDGLSWCSLIEEGSCASLGSLDTTRVSSIMYLLVSAGMPSYDLLVK
jgi:hypothetical protein